MTDIGVPPLEGSGIGSSSSSSSSIAAHYYHCSSNSSSSSSSTATTEAETSLLEEPWEPALSFASAVEFNADGSACAMGDIGGVAIWETGALPGPAYRLSLVYMDIICMLLYYAVVIYSNI
jgi:hypothetical protein